MGKKNGETNTPKGVPKETESERTKERTRMKNRLRMRKALFLFVEFPTIIMMINSILCRCHPRRLRHLHRRRRIQSSFDDAKTIFFSFFLLKHLCVTMQFYVCLFFRFRWHPVCFIFTFRFSIHFM